METTETKITDLRFHLSGTRFSFFPGCFLGFASERDTSFLARFLAVSYDTVRFPFLAYREETGNETGRWASFEK